MLTLYFMQLHLSRVPACEFNAMEAVKTNILGSNNVINACVDNNISKAVMLSTDKAVQPGQCNGYVKGDDGEDSNRSSLFWIIKQFSLLRDMEMLWGRAGSVIPIFVDKILKGEELLVTDPNMTRFMMSLQESVDLVVYALINSMQGRVVSSESACCYFRGSCRCARVDF